MTEDEPFRIYTPESLGAALKHYRRRTGLTQSELATLSGLNRTYVSDLEQGRQTEQLRRLFRILRQLGVRISLEKADW